MQQHAAQPEEIARNLKIDDLPLPILQYLVGTRPAGGKDISHLFRLPLMDEVTFGDENPAVLVVQHLQYGQFRS